MQKTAESVEASKKLFETTIQIEKNRLTYELIKEWSYDKKLLTFKREKIGEHFLNVEYSKFDYQKSMEFIGYFNNFFDYFTIVYELIKSKQINKELYIKILSKQIINFMKDEYQINKKVLHKIQNRFNKDGINIPAISTFDELREVVKLAEDKITPGTHTNFY